MYFNFWANISLRLELPFVENEMSYKFIFFIFLIVLQTKEIWWAKVSAHFGKYLRSNLFIITCKKDISRSCSLTVFLALWCLFGINNWNIMFHSFLFFCFWYLYIKTRYYDQLKLWLVFESVFWKYHHLRQNYHFFVLV